MQYERLRDRAGGELSLSNEIQAELRNLESGSTFLARSIEYAIWAEPEVAARLAKVRSSRP